MAFSDCLLLISLSLYIHFFPSLVRVIRLRGRHSARFPPPLSYTTPSLWSPLLFNYRPMSAYLSIQTRHSTTSCDKRISPMVSRVPFPLIRRLAVETIDKDKARVSASFRKRISPHPAMFKSVILIPFLTLH